MAQHMCSFQQRRDMDSSLLNIQMNERASVQDYVKQFSMVLNRGEGYDDAIAPIAFK